MWEKPKNKQQETLAQFIHEQLARTGRKTRNVCQIPLARDSLFKRGEKTQ